MTTVLRFIGEPTEPSVVGLFFVIGLVASSCGTWLFPVWLLMAMGTADFINGVAGRCLVAGLLLDPVLLLSLFPHVG
jgi:hypothetical protein